VGKCLGLLVALGVLAGTATSSQGATRIGIWVGSGPVGGYTYQTYGGYYYYPRFAPGSFQVVYSPAYRTYGWWDGGDRWHGWYGPRAWHPAPPGYVHHRHG